MERAVFERAVGERARRSYPKTLLRSPPKVRGKEAEQSSEAQGSDLSQSSCMMMVLAASPTWGFPESGAFRGSSRQSCCNRTEASTKIAACLP